MTPFKNFWKKEFARTESVVQILIYRALCLRELVGRDVKGLFAILSANRVRFVVDSAAIRDQCLVCSNFDLSGCLVALSGYM